MWLINENDVESIALLQQMSNAQKAMRIEIGQFEYTECWDGVLYKKLSGYPKELEKNIHE